MHRASLSVAFLCAVAVVAVAAPPKKHVIVDGSRARPVHRIPLFDDMGQKVLSTDNPAQPFSTEMTCGDCHDYDKIAMGWHFNSTAGNTLPGRPGEPWVVADEETGTQLPVSYRGWSGTWNPADAGLTYWDFTKRFGRHMPGGDMGEREDPQLNPKARWEISGHLEINCLGCHNAANELNQSEWAVQAGRENFRWAATGASGLGIVNNMASRLPDYFDFMNGPNRDSSWAAAPTVDYAANRFNKKGLVFFDVTDSPSVDHCYFCHSTIRADQDKNALWGSDVDVHVAAGLRCTDCHRNGLSHDIVRGYDGEQHAGNAASLTCRGCHLGDKSAQGVERMGGRLGAPRPLHKGLPPIHLEKLTCTACHSGVWPNADKTGLVRTARANRLGIHGRAQWDTTVPYILSPVFIRQDNGVIAPHNMMYPAFWAFLKDGKLKPILPEDVKPLVVALRKEEAMAKEQAKAKEAAPAETAPAETAPAEQPAESAAEKKSDSSSGESDPASAPEAKAEAKSAEGEGEGDKAEAKTEEAVAKEPEEAPEIPPLTDSQIATILSRLVDKGEGEPVYVAAGKLYRASGGKLVASDHEAAKPYAWPVAHDVRPAAQALGSGGCTDCHSDENGFFSAQVKADAPANLGPVVTTKMYAFERLSPRFLGVLEEGVENWKIYIALVAILGVFLIFALLHYGLVGLEGLFRAFVAMGSKKD